MLNNQDLLESLPLEELERIDAVCDALASAWKRGERLPLDEMLLTVPESLRSLTAAELIRTEIELRLTAGERPTASEYAVRFPQWSDELQPLIAQWLTVTSEVAKVDVDAAPQDTVTPTFENATLAPTVRFSAKDTADEFPLTALNQTSALVMNSIMGLDESVIQALRSRYEIRGILGRGGMGIVVKAHDLKLDRDVALKLLAPELSRDESAKQRFLREARAAAAVRHDNVVTIYSADEINDVPLLEMELIEGESLAERIKREGALPADEITRLALQMAHGLDAAHRRGLIHRDIKPSNILLEKSDLSASRAEI